MKPGNDKMLNMVKDKYRLGDGSESEESGEEDDVGNQQEFFELRRENQALQQEVNDMRQEVKDMRQIISNMKDLTNVNQALSELTKTINSMKPIKTCSTPTSSSSSSRASSPSRTPSGTKPKMELISRQRFDEDNTSDEATESNNMVLLCPGIEVLKAEKKMLDTCGDAKVYTYTLMEMLRSREVLATHSLTGNSSNAHKDKEPKPCLDQVKVKALYDLVVRKYKLPEEQRVKNLIKAKLQNVEKCEKLKKAMAIGQS